MAETFLQVHLVKGTGAKTMRTKVNRNSVRLHPEERELLIGALQEWHDNDTAKHNNAVPDDDEMHYFIEDFLNELKGTDEPVRTGRNRKY